MLPRGRQDTTKISPRGCGGGVGKAGRSAEGMWRKGAEEVPGKGGRRREGGENALETGGGSVRDKGREHQGVGLAERGGGSGET